MSSPAMLPQTGESTRALAGALVAGAAAAAAPRVVAVAGPTAGAAFAIEDGALLGRSRRARLRLLDPAASGLHLRFALGAAGAVVEDVGSRNGATLNGRPLPPGETPLADGDELGVGDTILKVEGVAPPAGIRDRDDGTVDRRRRAAGLPVAIALLALAFLALAAAVALGAG